jgi:hypothetical protein
MGYPNLVERNLDLAAGTHVSREAYENWGINLAKLQSLGRCYRNGWLHNVLRRITPLTINQFDDYLMMADLFIANAADAKLMLGQMSQDLSKFATAAGVVPSLTGSPPMLHNHLRLYFELAALLEYKFMISIPAPFASTTVDVSAQEEIPFIRSYLKQRFAA